MHPKKEKHIILSIPFHTQLTTNVPTFVFENCFWRIMVERVYNISCQSVFTNLWFSIEDRNNFNSIVVFVFFIQFFFFCSENISQLHIFVNFAFLSQCTFSCLWYPTTPMAAFSSFLIFFLSSWSKKALILKFFMNKNIYSEKIISPVQEQLWFGSLIWSIFIKAWQSLSLLLLNPRRRNWR